MVVFAGLPGSGKSVLARGVADAIGATYLRIDTIESAIVSTLMPYRDNPVGYVVAERVAADQLVAGRDVVADAVNGVAAARAGWVALAARTGAALRFVEVRCRDVANIAAGWRRASRRCPGTAFLPGSRCYGVATSHGRRNCVAGSSLTTSALRRDTWRTSSPSYRRRGRTGPATEPDAACDRPGPPVCWRGRVRAGSTGPPCCHRAARRGPGCAHQKTVRDGRPAAAWRAASAVTPAPQGEAGAGGRIIAGQNPRHEGCSDP